LEADTKGRVKQCCCKRERKRITKEKKRGEAPSNEGTVPRHQFQLIVGVGSGERRTGQIKRSWPPRVRDFSNEGGRGKTKRKSSTGLTSKFDT